MNHTSLLNCIYDLADDRFDLIYPPEIRALSDVHWTPIRIARLAANFLAHKPGTRVLDIGSGPGKFCLVGALTTGGSFTGVEQRKHLCDAAQIAIGRAGIHNAEIIHGNVDELTFSNFDAFYLFNPFEENLDPSFKIDESVDLSLELYEKYSKYVAQQLAVAPLWTRVVTYCSACEEVPPGYQSIAPPEIFGLKFWQKANHFPLKSQRTLVGQSKPAAEYP